MTYRDQTQVPPRTQISRRRVLQVLAAVGAAPTLSPADAQDVHFPGRPVVILVGAAAGGTSDNMTRVITQRMGEKLGQPVLVENKPGAGSSVAASAGARAVPDGHTLIMSSAGPMILNRLLMKSLPYDPEKDFASVGTFVRFQCVLVANVNSPYRTLGDVVTYARANPGKLQFASGGALATPHLSVEMLESLTSVQMTHVPYRGDAPAIQDVMGGHVPLMTAGMPGVMALIKAGSLRPIVVFGQSRSPHFPEVPTASESGVPDLVVESWMALSAPGATPKAVIAKLNDAVRFAVAQDDVKARVRELGGEIYFGTPEELDVRIGKEREVWTKIIRKAGIQPS